MKKSDIIEQRRIAIENELPMKVMVDNGKIVNYIPPKINDGNNCNPIWDDGKELMIAIVNEEDYNKYFSGCTRRAQIIPYEYIEWIEISGSVQDMLKVIKNFGDDEGSTEEVKDALLNRKPKSDKS